VEFEAKSFDLGTINLGACENWYMAPVAQPEGERALDAGLPASRWSPEGCAWGGWTCRSSIGYLQESIRTSQGSHPGRQKNLENKLDGRIGKD
jgi:hypothetical protein